MARDGDEVLGWAALSRASIRDVYEGVAECSVYVSEDARGRGVGELLLEALEQSADAGGIWTLEAVVFPENEASVAMLESCGFRVVGRRERLGKLHGRVARRAAAGAARAGGLRYAVPAARSGRMPMEPERSTARLTRRVRAVISSARFSSWASGAAPSRQWRGVVVDQLDRDPVEGGLGGADLLEHVDAVPLVGDHPGDAPHLALDAVEALEDVVRRAGRRIPRSGRGLSPRVKWSCGEIDILLGGMQSCARDNTPTGYEELR